MTSNVDLQPEVSTVPLSETVDKAQPGRWAWFLQRLIRNWMEAQYFNWQYNLSANGEDP